MCKLSCNPRDKVSGTLWSTNVDESMFPQPLVAIPIARDICTDTKTVARIKETIVQHPDVAVRLFRVRATSVREKNDRCSIR